jgi:chaperone required for assembly of F1-ATPase
MRKFYKTAEAGTAPNGYVVRLDGKILKTPLKNTILLDSKPLAEAIAAEWEAQDSILKPAAMPLTQLTNTMIDKSKGEDRAAMNAQILDYAMSDLVCYFADHPQDLVKRHQTHWLPLLAWMQEKYGVVLEPVSGIKYHHQQPETLQKLKKIIAGLNPKDFTVLQSAAAVMGSVVIAFALMDEKITVAQAHVAACVDEFYQLEKWGADDEAQQRLDYMRWELETIMRFKSLMETVE